MVSCRVRRRVQSFQSSHRASPSGVFWRGTTEEVRNQKLRQRRDPQLEEAGWGGAGRDPGSLVPHGRAAAVA